MSSRQYPVDFEIIYVLRLGPQGSGTQMTRAYRRRRQDPQSGGADLRILARLAEQKHWPQ